MKNAGTSVARSSRGRGIVVFAGPTITRDEVLTHLPQAEYRPPAKRGDVYQAATRRPIAIALIDGLFDTVPSVWHKEILWAIHAGVLVFGAASMGALRAAELHQYGMRGTGRIFESYRDGVLCDDDEVAVAHLDEEHSYRPVSVSMVDIRATLHQAAADGVIDAFARASLEEIAKVLYYPDRTYARVLCEGGRRNIEPDTLIRLDAWMNHGRIEQKKLDGIELLDRLAHISVDTPTPRSVFTFEATTFWRQLLRELAADSLSR